MFSKLIVRPTELSTERMIPNVVVVIERVKVVRKKSVGEGMGGERGRGTKKIYFASSSTST